MKLLLYCTKAKPYLVERLPFNEKKFYQCRKKNDYYSLNGKIVAECDFEVEYFNVLSKTIEGYKEFERKDVNYVLERSCLSYTELVDYLGENKVGYTIHIKNLHIFDNPRELKDFDQVNNCCFEKEVDKDWEELPIYACVFTNCCRYQSDGHTCDKHFYSLKRIHNMSKVFDNKDCKWKYVISLSPQEMCRVANKEQTALVRRSVLKEMMNNE